MLESRDQAGLVLPMEGVVGIGSGSISQCERITIARTVIMPTSFGVKIAGLPDSH
jgi:hypothetical protein